MLTVPVIRDVLLFLSFVFLFYLALKKDQNSRINWAMFFSSLWIASTLPLFNIISVDYGLWSFAEHENTVIQMPWDLYFVWIVLWGVMPVYFLRGNYMHIVSGVLFWIDFVLMPMLQSEGLLTLHEYWWLGDLLLIILVFLPGYLWARIFIYRKLVWLRALMQMFVMGIFLFLTIPFCINIYFPFQPDYFHSDSLTTQLSFMISLPSLIAVLDLVQKGKGTPFPYDQTNNLVRNGVYAYIKNPIQWSFTFIFIPISIYYDNYWILIGTLISIFYVIGVSNHQEHEDMFVRFGKEWDDYNNSVPSWIFLWKPEHYPVGKIYFQKGCNPCEGVHSWFKEKETVNLEVDYEDNYHKKIAQVTYVDYLGNEYRSVDAIAHAFEHINLAWASLGWFMRLPVIHELLQVIVDGVGFNEAPCEIENGVRKQKT
ncbi:methyltransferase family protein [Aureibacter tunicatorum]|uniref:Protein-S-isoprenylcysteine O-methyltransferase Ste14 n=1 Tax=Aureibacter tunicatorum TaxID=866807 RepID=A0AAE4BU46_9BACT|nr:methyltransferase [Aureibacter tunicatorum]MDR6240342.1 protein-S-isoprenylcysteine O-methyltransferase Ste14 [Aureibacter tunicatorum]BDD05777.1 hypothetical protein AUTU_32600 [Aureibacter tunicatorum]